ncbi:hypothetical protein C1645_815121 [Glomus cerebriforme]|uniref:Uncharacterized protein n=1 Tax=Glomus cerebriforme TaxID=658196 RepID=A0A397TJE3_9GLOM|nr:hypothetical protein C1645_815121 [Glomus cerebriforme]
MKSSFQVPTVPFNNTTNQLIQNPKGIDSRNIIFQLNLQYMKYLKRTERLLVHSYDIRIAKRKNDQSLKNTKLIDLLEGNLYSTKDYLSVIQLIIDIPELYTYLEKNIFIAPMDYPGQKNIYRTIIYHNIIPLVLDFFFVVDARKHTRKQCYAYGPFFIDIDDIKHSIVETFKTSLHIFNDYYVKNFHSSIRHQTNSFNTALQIIHQAKVIDQTYDKNSFTEQYNLPTLGKIVNKKVLPIGWNSSCPPKLDRLCNWNKCALSSEVPDNCMTFQNILNKKFDDDKESSEDLEDQVNLQDDNNNEIVSADEDINRKLEEALELFNLCQ